MRLGSLFNRTAPEYQISSVEAFNIWSSLRARYISIEKNQFLSNFVHDKSLALMMENDLKTYKKQIDILEKMLKQFRIKAPHKPPTEIKFTSEIDAVTDQMVFKFTVDDIETELYNLKRSMVSSTASEKLRKMFIDFTNEHLDAFSQFYKYGKIKGWTDIAPAYKIKITKLEPLSVSEANHIWDHLNLRHDHIQLTDFFLDFIHDADFQLILKNGKRILKKQVKLLEKLAVKYEVPLPVRPPAVMEAPIDPEIMEDQFAYRIIIAGIQSSIDLHIRAVIESIRNDSLRDIFYDLLQNEYNVLDNLFKYGKIKGWLHIVPTYKIKS